VEELNLVLEFSVFVDAHRRVRRLRCNKLEEGIDADTLNELTVSFKRLKLLVLPYLDAPKD